MLFIWQHAKCNETCHVFHAFQKLNDKNTTLVNFWIGFINSSFCCPALCKGGCCARVISNWKLVCKRSVITWGRGTWTLMQLHKLLRASVCMDSLHVELCTRRQQQQQQIYSLEVPTTISSGEATTSTRYLLDLLATSTNLRVPFQIAVESEDADTGRSFRYSSGLTIIRVGFVVTSEHCRRQRWGASCVTK